MGKSASAPTHRRFLGLPLKPGWTTQKSVCDGCFVSQGPNREAKQMGNRDPSAFELASREDSCGRAGHWHPSRPGPGRWGVPPTEAACAAARPWEDLHRDAHRCLDVLDGHHERRRPPGVGGHRVTHASKQTLQHKRAPALTMDARTCEAPHMNTACKLANTRVRKHTHKQTAHSTCTRKATGNATCANAVKHTPARKKKYWKKIGQQEGE